MANEISIKPYIKCANGRASITIQLGVLSFNQSAAGFYHNIATIGTTEESIASFGDVASEGWIYVRNIDATNFVDWGFSTAVYGGGMAAGETVMFRAKPGLTLFFKADTADCKIEILCLEA